MSSKRRAAGAGIKAAFQRQADRAEAAAATAVWAPLEVSADGVPAVPDDYLQEFSAKYDAYTNRRDTIAKQLASSKPAGPAQRNNNNNNDAADEHQHQQEQEQQPSADTAKWQAAAAFCVQQLSMWPGSGVALQLQQQEALLHIVVNHELHPDPMLSSKAHSLLLQNLATHPPVQCVLPAGAGQDQQQQAPPVLQSACSNGLCWDLFNHHGKPLLPDAASPFPLLQQLVRNAVGLVTGDGSGASVGAGAGAGTGAGAAAATSSAGSSGSGARAAAAAEAAGGSQGQAMLLLYVVQLLQADLLVRQVAFERYMQLSTSLTQEAQQQEAAARAATALQHSLIYRVMQDDSVGGDSWRFIPGSSKGKHQLVRDLLLLVSCTGHEADAQQQQQAPQRQRSTGAAAAAAAAAGPTDAAAVGGDTEMTDAADAAIDTAPAAAAAGAGAAVASQQQAGSDLGAPVSSQELIQAARVLLLLLLQLYSSCEEAGVYGRAGEGRHHMQRLVGSGQPNDRFELDDVMLTAISSCGHVSTHALPQLEQFSRLERLLLALPPVHRARLLALMVVSVVHNRVVDPESEGKLAQAAHNLELQGLRDYLTDRGRGYAGFRQPHTVHIIEAVDARLEWAAKEMFGGKLLFAFVLGSLISTAAASGMQDAPGPDRQSFAAASGRIIEHVLQKQRGAMAADVARWGHCEALCALAAAKQRLQALQAA